MKWTKFSIRQILGDRSFFFSIFVAMVISLTGLHLLETFKASFQSDLDGKAREIMGADLTVSSRIKPSSETLERLRNELSPIDELSIRKFFSMAKSSTHTRLVYLQEVKENFPFYGELKLSDQKIFKGKGLASNEVIVFPEVLQQLKLEVGDRITIGNGEFIIKNFISEDSGQVFDTGSVAPKILITTEGIELAKVLKKGSTVVYLTAYKLKKSVSLKQQQDFVELVNDNAIKVQIPKDSSDQVSRVIDYVTDFLGLTSIVALLLSYTGIFFLYQSYLAKKLRSFEILQAIGMTRKKVLLSQLLIIIPLMIFSSIASGALSSLLSIPLEFVLNNYFAISVKLQQTSGVWMGNFFMSTIGGALLFAPLLIGKLFFQQHGEVSLFDNQVSSSRLKLLTFREGVFFIPFLLFLTGIAIYLSHSYLVGSIFILVVMGTFLVLTGGLSLVLIRLEKIISPKTSTWKLALSYLCRYRFKTASIFIAIFLAISLMNVIFTFKSGVESELTTEDNRPQIFLFDIQEDQELTLKKMITEYELKNFSFSPMIRARLTKINDLPVKVEVNNSSIREQQRETRFRNRGVNLSYRKSLAPEESLLDGELLTPSSEQVSLEYRYAKRLGIKIGDKVTFDIMGIDQSAVVKNLRKVRWTSFKPNFFILFPEGVLEDAPKTFLSALGGSEEKVNEFQNALVDEFPNVSAVNIRRVVQKVMDVINQMSYVLLSMSLLVGFVGVFVLAALINYVMGERGRDIFLLRLVGVNSNQLISIVRREFFPVVITATVSGVIFGSSLGYLFTEKLFQTSGSLNVQFSLWSGVITIVICLVTAELSIKRFKNKDVLF